MEWKIKECSQHEIYADVWSFCGKDFSLIYSICLSHENHFVLPRICTIIKNNLDMIFRWIIGSDNRMVDVRKLQFKFILLLMLYRLLIYLINYIMNLIQMTKLSPIKQLSSDSDCFIDFNNIPCWFECWNNSAVLQGIKNFNKLIRYCYCAWPATTLAPMRGVIVNCNF